MNTKLKRHERPETYKLHATIASGVDQGRETTRRLFFGLVAGLWAFLATALTDDLTSEKLKFALILGACAGSILCIFWFLYMRYYNWSHRAKANTLLDLDSKLVYPFLNRESDQLTRVEPRSVRVKQQAVDILPPTVFLFLFGGLFLIALR